MNYGCALYVYVCVCARMCVCVFHSHNPTKWEHSYYLWKKLRLREVLLLNRLET